MDKEPFLLIPELLALSQPHCLKIEMNGKTEQSDFVTGYILESTGTLKEIRPDYGYPELNRQWVCWRTFRYHLHFTLELTPACLFISHSELAKLIEPVAKEAETQKAKPTARKPKPDIDSSSTQPISTDIISDSPPSPNHAELDQSISPLKDLTGDLKKHPKEQHVNSPESVTTSHAILRIADVATRTGLSRSTIYDKLNQKSKRHDATFPKSISLGLNSVGWIDSEVTSWIDLRKNTNRA